MNGLGLFLVALPLLTSGARTDVAVGGTLQSKVGLLPLPNNGGSSFGVETSLSPMAGIQRSSALTTVSLTYVPRFTLRIPSVLIDQRPLIFQSLRASYSTRLSRRFSLGARADAGIGELSYGDARLVFDPGTSLPQEVLISMFRITGSAQMSYTFAADHTTSLSVSGGYREPLAGADSDSANFAPSTNLNARIAHSVITGPRQSVIASFNAGRVVTDAQDTTTLTAGAAISQGFARSTLVASVGGNYGIQSDMGTYSRVFPSGTVSYSTTWRATKASWNMGSEVGVNAFFDELAADYRARLSLNWGLGMRHLSNWDASVNAALQLPLSDRATSVELLETQLSLRVPVNIQIRPGLSATTGLSIGLRAPHPSLIEAENIQTELAGFVGLTYRNGTGPGRGRWL